MDTLLNVAMYLVFVGIAIFSAYRLGFNIGEDKGRSDMLAEITSEAKPEGVQKC